MNNHQSSSVLHRASSNVGTPRRSWPHELKMEIAAESFVPGVIQANIARKHKITSGQLSDWRRDYQAEQMRLSCSPASSFVQVALPASKQEMAEQNSAPCDLAPVIGLIEAVMMNGHTVRISQCCGATLRLVLDVLASR